MKNKVYKNISIEELHQRFQNSPHKVHYDSFINSSEGLHKQLSLIFSNHSFIIDLHEKLFSLQKSSNSEAISYKTADKYSLKVDFRTGEPIMGLSQIGKNKMQWDAESLDGKNIIESFSGYLHIKLPVTICASLQGNKKDGKKLLKEKQIDITFRRFPLPDNQSRFWWGMQGHEIQRMPIGLIRYAPGPLLERTTMSDEMDRSKIEGTEYYSRLFIRGEFGDTLLLEINNASFTLNRLKDLSDMVGNLAYKNRKVSIQDILNDLDEDLKSIIVQILNVKYTERSQNVANKDSSKFKALNKNWHLLYLSELGRKRLENKLMVMLGDDYQLFNKFIIPDNAFISKRDIAMIIAGLAKNYPHIPDISDDKLHLGNRRVLLLHHLVSKSIYEGFCLAFNNPISTDLRLPLDQLAENVMDRSAELLELGTILTEKRLHKYIIHSTQLVDNTNPLSLLSQRRKISFCGLGGIKTSYTSGNIGMRDVHPSHYGRICIVETNEGKSVGLNLQLAANARIRYNGEIETPYKMSDGSIKWWSASEEMIHESETGKPLNIKFIDSPSLKDTILVHSNTSELNTISKSPHNDLLEDISLTQPFGPAALLIPFIEHTDGTRAMMAAKNMKQALIPEKPEEPIIQTSFDNILTIADFTEQKERKKILTPGVNALVAYMPWKGYNFEDGIVCSESFSIKMTTIHQKKVLCELFYRDMLIFQSDSPVWHPVGSSISTDDLLFKVERNKEDGRYVEEIRSGFSGILMKVERLSLMHPSVARYAKEPFDIYKAYITQKKPLKVGDKIMGRHGNKGIISLILPDNEMPRLADGTPIEIILNPNGVISRMNLSQILETHWGWIAYNRKSRRNKSLIFQPLNGPSEEKLQNRLKKLPHTDSSGKVTITFHVDGKEIKRPVVTGLQYIMKLNHLAEDKLKIRTIGEYNQLTGGAVKGKGGGQRIGEMEFWALRSFGADATISETYRIKNLTYNNDRRTPLTSISLDSILKTMGLVMCADSGSVSYRFASEGAISTWGPKVKSSDIWKPDSRRFLTCKICHKPVIGGLCDICKSEIQLSCNKKGTIEAECSCRSKYLIPWRCECGSTSVIKRTFRLWGKKEEGLLDPELFGSSGSEKYLTQLGYIKLNVPVFNPLYSISIGKNRNKGIIRGLTTYVLNMKKGEEYLKEVSVHLISGYKKNPDNVLTPVDALKRQFSKKLNTREFEELTIRNLPIIPLAFRDPESHSYDLHKAYLNILKINERLKTTKNLLRSRGFAISLQRAVYKLFWGDNKPNNRGLTGRLQGREGLLRSAIIARRVDFSARAVIVPAPQLHIDECILPRKMENLFDASEYEGKRLFSQKSVLIHRAATLHKYNILSFKIKRFWDQDVIGLPPLACSYMNADFDGDTVAVHLPLSAKANLETSQLSPRNYLFGYANSSFMPHITQDIVLGLYCLAKSTKGRKVIAGILDVSLKDVKPPLTVQNIKKLCENFARRNANNVAAIGLYKLAILGFKEATLSSATFSIFDVPAITPKKRIALKNANPDAWRQKVSESVQNLSKRLADEDNPNGVAWMIVSGARGAKDQVVQLGGMRGSMYRPDGKRIGVPVEGNFREGLKSYEYWISAPGTRKGMIDKHVNTQPAGILHRKLVETGYPLEIIMEDCRTTEGIFIKKEWNIPKGILLGYAQKVPFFMRIIGRTLIKPINLKLNNKSFNIPEGKEIDYALAVAIEQNRGLEEVKVRSPLLCKADKGVCSKCYGLSLDKLEQQKVGTPVGLIAGHIIGERGVQLAMRTFHTGGASVSGVVLNLLWIRKFLGANKVPLPVYEIAINGQKKKLNKWLLILHLMHNPVNSIIETPDIEEDTIDSFLFKVSFENKDDSWGDIISYFLHVMSFEALSFYSGNISNIHFETLFKAMLAKNKTFRGIFTQAGMQGSVLASAAHDRAVQRIFKAALNQQKDINIPWRERFMQGLL